MIATIVYSGPPIDVCIEASWWAINENDLDTWNGEQYDWIKNCITVERDSNNTMFTTTRGIEAWKAGVPNAGRGTLVIENKYIERVILPNKEDK